MNKPGQLPPGRGENAFSIGKVNRSMAVTQSHDQDIQRGADKAGHENFLDSASKGQRYLGEFDAEGTTVHDVSTV